MRRYLLVFFLSWNAVWVSAQTPLSHPTDEARRNARAHVGPFYITPALQLKELGVDTNVFNEAGEQKSDFMFNLSPKADVLVALARRALITTTVATDLVWYRRYDTERSVDPQAAARAEIYMHRLTLFAQDAYLNTRQRPNLEIDLRSRHLENNVEAGAEYRLTPKLSFSVSGRRAFVRFDADAFFLGSSLQETLNRNTTGVNAAVKHKLSPLTTLSVKGERFSDEFPFSPQRDTDSLRVMPGVEFKPRALVSGSAFVGFRKFTPQDAAALPEFTGLVANLGLSYTLLGATTFGVSYVRDVNYSFEPLQPYFVSNSAGASVRQALGRKFDVLVSADRADYSYRDLRVGPPLGGTQQPPLDAREDTTWIYAGSLGFRPGRQTRIGVGGSYYKRESTTRSLRDYDGLRFGTTVTYGF
jgi:putative beta-barrel porin BBP2